VSKAILKTLLYFDIFKHPLTSEEIFSYSQRHPIPPEEIGNELKNLENEGYLNQKNNFFFLNNDESVIERRQKGKKCSEKYLTIAIKFSKLIASFPFVEGVFLSGSLAKGYMDKETDIDYFIITKPGRLWFSRTLLVLFKKIFLLNSHKYFCVNYFIDSNNLEIPDKNIFTATEIIFLIPTYNEKLYNDFINANLWVSHYYPNFHRTPSERILQERNPRVKKIVEKLFSKNIGEKSDALCFKITLKFWKRKFKNFDKEQFDLNLRSRKNTSKHHPNEFQKKILAQHGEKIAAFEKQFNLKLS